jgi:predicted dehydrogenase
MGCDQATSDYGRAFSRLRRATLAAVVDPDDATARRAAETLEAPLWATTFDDLLRDAKHEFDAVVIRRATGSPETVVAQAAAAGKHVLLDMPLLLGMSLEDTPIAACQSANVTLMAGQVTRFLPSVVEVKNCLQSEVLGTPGLLRIHNWRPPDAAATILEALLRDVDLANWLFAALPTEIYAAGRAGPEGDRGSYDYVQVHFGYAGGGMALLDQCRTLPPGSDYFSLSLFGSAGAAYADDHHNMHLLYRGGRPTALPAGQGRLHHLAELQEFVDAIETGREPAITTGEGYQVAKVVWAVKRSLESGHAVKLVGDRYEPV